MWACLCWGCCRGCYHKSEKTGHTHSYLSYMWIISATHCVNQNSLSSCFWTFSHIYGSGRFKHCFVTPLFQWHLRSWTACFRLEPVRPDIVMILQVSCWSLLALLRWAQGGSLYWDSEASQGSDGGSVLGISKFSDWTDAVHHLTTQFLPQILLPGTMPALQLGFSFLRYSEYIYHTHKQIG